MTSLAHLASSPKSKLVALNTKIYNARHHNQSLRQSIALARHSVTRAKTKKDSVHRNLDSLHRENLRRTASHDRNSTSFRINQRECQSLQAKLRVLEQETKEIDTETISVKEKIKQEEEASISLVSLSVRIKGDLVKKKNYLARLRKLYANLEQRKKGSDTKIKNKTDLLAHRTTEIKNRLKKIRLLSSEL